MQIGFTCEPEVCESTKEFEVGDEVLVTLGAVNHKNKLLKIQLCLKIEKVCVSVLDEDKQRRKQQDINDFKFSVQKMQCRSRMMADLKNDSRYKTENWIARILSLDRDIVDEYYEMLENPDIKECLEKIIEAHTNAFIESCIKHGCGYRIGGGCYHIVNNTKKGAAVKYAINQCQ